MNNRVEIVSKWILLACLFLITACSNTSVRQHQDFYETARSIDSVIIVPPEVVVELVTFTGENEQLVEREATVKSCLVSLAKQRLESHGLRVIDFDFLKAIESDEEFAYALTQCREAFKAAQKDLYSGDRVSEDDKDKFQASIGPVVNAIVEKTGAESMLLMEYYGFEKSGGMIAKDVAVSVLLALLTGSVPVQATEGAALQVSLIDTVGGDVLWTNSKSAQEIDSSLLNIALEELPDVTWEAEISLAKSVDPSFENAQ